MQRGVPLQPHDHVLQVGDDHLGADALQPMHASEKADGRHVQRRFAHADGMDRKAVARRQLHLPNHLHLQMGCPQLDDFFERQQLGQRVHGGWRWRRGAVQQGDRQQA